MIERCVVAGLSMTEVIALVHIRFEVRVIRECMS